MKKTLLAVAIPAVLFAHSASAVEILKTDEALVDFYGQLRTQLEKSEDDDVTLNAGSSRAGVQAQYAVTDSVDIFGQVEFGLQGNGGELNNRLHFVGVDTDYGKIAFGRQWLVSDDIYGADYSYFFGGTALRYSTLSGALHDSLIKYNYEGENFIVAANYGLSEDDSNQELAELYVASSYGGFNFHVGGGVNRDKAFKVGTQTIEITPDYEVSKAITADLENTYFEGTVEYTFGAALVGFTYYNAELKNKANGDTIDEDGYSLAGTYSWAENATAYAGFEYVEQESKALNVDGDGKLFYIGTDYHFNSWSRIYFEYGYGDGTTLGYNNKNSDNQIEAQSVDSESFYAIGARVYW
ncbi:porin [Photobacterium sp. ZSDE20]|uniref:Porin n=1 Tax=Photobacterium pectinilyticum TaxID=2906793 RepID=A0ABT1N0G4_9GAMM|nr:porin [Photobacterium sp. ZSDE20]MCQ1058231.1 porin [Photobacterium sp. ZSDE20]MDD1822954.1 porin [Photobacterium sp. ZSDE20]